MNIHQSYLNELKSILLENDGNIIIKFPIKCPSFQISHLKIRKINIDDYEFMLKYRIECMDDEFSHLYGIFSWFEEGMCNLFQDVSELKLCMECIRLGCNQCCRDENGECCICLEPVSRHELSCGHLIHKICLIKLRELLNTKCPLCRKKIKKKDFKVK
jgi:hypothetical protein